MDVVVSVFWHSGLRDVEVFAYHAKIPKEKIPESCDMFPFRYFSIWDFVMLDFLLTMQKSQNRNSRNPEIETQRVTISEIDDL
jgi:hypothetical protein